VAGKAIFRASCLALVIVGNVGVLRAQTPALGYDLRTGDLVQKQGPNELKRSTPPPVTGALPKEVENPRPECGPNAMYVFLRLRNVACELAKLKREIPLEENGVSMLHLRGAAQRYGVDVSVLQVTPSQLTAATPAIVRMQSNKAPQEGHYVVLTQIDDELAQVIDSAGGATIRMPRSTFDREFSGYALAQDVGRSFPLGSYLNFTTVAGAVCAAEVGFIIYLGFAARRARAVKPSLVGPQA